MTMRVIRYSSATTYALVFLLCHSHSNAQLSENANSLQNKTLADLATEIRPDFLLGTHTSALHMPDTPQNKKPQRIISTEYNLISVGIYQKQTQREGPDVWNFRTADPIVQFATEHGLTVYAHPMFGSNGYLPNWLLQGEFSDEQLLNIIEDRIRTVLSRYKGRIHILDVYNEGLSRSNGRWREPDNLFLKLGWHENEHGRWPIALEKILVWCRQYGGEDLKLIYNENHNTLAGMPQALACIRLHKALKKAGIPIDGIGIQCHTKITEEGEHQLSASPHARGSKFDAKSFAKNMHSMGEAGIDVYVTECDVHLYGTIDEQKLALQADAYRAILNACIEEPACKSLKTWGFTDASCWKPLKKNNKRLSYEPCPLVFDHDCEPKPAYRAMKALLVEKAARKDRLRHGE